MVKTIGCWNSIITAPTNGSKLLVSDGKDIWFASKKEASFTPRDGMGPFDGHDWHGGPDGQPPRWWMRPPRLPHPALDD